MFASVSANTLKQALAFFTHMLSGKKRFLVTIYNTSRNNELALVVTDWLTVAEADKNTTIKTS